MDTLRLLDSEELVALARIDLETNQLADALAKLKFAKSLGDFPTNLHALLGRLFARLGLFSRAQREFSAYLEQQPDAVLERFELGSVYRDNGDAFAALEEWNRVLEINTDYPPALFFKSMVLLDNNNHDEGISGLQQLIRTTNPDNLYVTRAQEVLKLLNSNELATTGISIKETRSPTH